MVKTDESDSESPNAQHAKLRMVDWPLKMFGENDCNRVSAKHRLPDGKCSSLDLSVTAAVVVTREKFAASTCDSSNPMDVIFQSGVPSLPSPQDMQR